jgi:CRP-like cAMP-binding protein
MMIAHTQQVAACNAKHGLEERLCRWLLQARDLMGSGDLRVTQEFLAEMLGMSRSSVTLVARRLAATGFISYNWGRAKLLDLGPT